MKTCNYAWGQILTRHRSGHFALRTNIESLCCTLEHIMLYVDNTSVKKISTIILLEENYAFLYIRNILHYSGFLL